MTAYQVIRDDDGMPTELREIDREIVWEAILCHGCGRRLFNDDGKPARSWRRWVGC